MTGTQGVVDVDAVSQWLATLGTEFTAPLQFQRLGLRHRT